MRCRCAPLPPHTCCHHHPPTRRTIYQSRRILQHPSSTRLYNICLATRRSHRKPTAVRSCRLPRCRSSNLRWCVQSRPHRKSHNHLHRPGVCPIRRETCAGHVQRIRSVQIQRKIITGLWEWGWEVVHFTPG